MADEAITEKEKRKIEHVKNGEEFVNLMIALKPDELCALAKFLDVRILTDDFDKESKKAKARDAFEIIDDCIMHFAQLDRTDRRFLIKTMRNWQNK